MTSIVDRVDRLSDVYTPEALAQADHLAKQNPENENEWEMFVSPLLGDNLTKSVFGGAGALPENNFLDDNLFVTADKEYLSYRDIT